jgi:hypothetical protein
LGGKPVEEGTRLDHELVLALDLDPVSASAE